MAAAMINQTANIAIRGHMFRKPGLVQYVEGGKPVTGPNLSVVFQVFHLLERQRHKQTAINKIAINAVFGHAGANYIAALHCHAADHRARRIAIAFGNHVEIA